MSKGIVDTIIGGVEIVAGILLAPFIGPLAGFLVAAGIGMLFTGVGTLISGTASGGVITATRNPVKDWDVVYGRARIGGEVLFADWPKQD